MKELQLKYLSSQDKNFWGELKTLLALDNDQNSDIDQTVTQILQHVKTDGDAAVLAYTARFDHIQADSLLDLAISQAELQSALASLPTEQRNALEQAVERIHAYHERQKSSSWQYTDTDGNLLGQKVTALERVGLYVPGGKAAYPSSVLMNAIPAKVAGVKELTMVVPTPHGEKNTLVLAAAALAGVDNVFCIGGAQAVGALAYGTKTIQQVDKIVGPGNAYVASAKRQVFGVVGIDMVAGPSEILIITDGTAPVDWLVMDLFSQAEHDELAQAILISTSADYLQEVAQRINALLPSLPRHEIIATALSHRGGLIHVSDLQEAVEISNYIAPEHLELAVTDPVHWAEKIQNAGAIFMGSLSCEALGDYCAGPNHVLPTSRTARFSSPLGVYDFQKRSSLIMASAIGANRLGKVASVLARGEGLQAHAQSAEFRIKG